ncbi:MULTISPECIES: helix-turn-helix domain-containing protein [Bacillus cereus group]|uniref:helix-turn-helix domain-containing protein n=1 Tax=Bacillus cereus group TaxID=86661 RepID=UPI00311AB1DB
MEKRSTCPIPENKIGNRIKEVRVDILDLRQEDFAKLINIAKSMISLYENGRRKPSRETVENISTISGVSADYIMGISDNKYQNEHNMPQSEKELLNTFNKVKLLPLEQQDKIREVIENILILIDLEKKS